jgi:hypothetical protein
MPDVDFVVDEDDEYASEGFSKSPQASNRPKSSSSSSSSSKPSSTALTKKNDDVSNLSLPGVRLPFAALHPAEGKAAAAAAASSASARTRDTLIIQRSSRGINALKPVVYRSAEDKDFSSFYKEEVKVYHKEYLNEMSYCMEQKEKSAERRRIEEAKAAADLKAELAAFKGKKSDTSSSDSSEGLGAFFERQDAVERRRVQAREEAVELHEYSLLPKEDKKMCRKCGAMQSFAEYKGRIKRCPKDTCGGAPYLPRLLWSEVQDSFLGRWKSGLVKASENLKKLDDETRPPFRVTHRKVFNKETGEMEDQPIPKVAWEAVGDEFIVRQEEVVARLNARIAAAAAQKAAPVVFVKEKGPKSKFKLSKPLPDFFARQAAMSEKRNATFEERLAMMNG